MVPQVAAARPIVAIGDTSRGIRPASRYSAILQARLRVAVVDASVAGDTSAGILARLDNALARRPRAVLVKVGSNDAARQQGPPRVGLDEYGRNLTAIVRRIRAARAKAVLLTPNPMTRRYRYQRLPFYQTHDINDGVAPYAEATRRVARLEGACLVDVFADWIWRREHSRWVLDGLHANATGHRRIADLVLARCARDLKQ